MQDRNMPPRTHEIDFIKAVMILLMIVFHLVYIGDTYAYAKQVVYTFHIPVFLVISGYLLNTGKPVRRYAATLLWIFIPYAVMEGGYTLMAALLPIREHVDNLTPALLADKILLHPLGPYWYLHTLMLCGLVCFAVMRLPRLTLMSRLIVLALCYWAMSRLLHIVSLPCALYFMAGAVLRSCNVRFLSFFRPSALAAIPFVMLVCIPQCHDKAVFGGMCMVYLAIVLCISLSAHCPGGILRTMLFIGRNTLPLLLFSPIFTVLSKTCQPLLLSMDPTGMLFLAVSLVFAVTGCLLIGAAMDCTGVSRLFFGKKRIMN